MQKYKHRALGDVFLVLVALFAIGPIVWALVTSLKVTQDVMSAPPIWVPERLTLEHYHNILFGSQAPRFLFNTFVVAAASAIGAVVIGLLGGYSAARLKFRGKNATLLMLLASSMVPGIAILVALYKVGVDNGLDDTFVYLVAIFVAWQMPTVLWMMRGFVQATPRETEEAAMIDGTSRFGAFVRVTVPQLRAGMAAAGIIVFVFVWNDWLVASIIISSADKTLVQPGLFRYAGDSGVRWGDFMAYAMVATIPIVIVFAALRRHFVSGLSAGSLKG